MAAYGVGEYGGWRYSIGISTSGVAVSSGSSAAGVGYRVGVSDASTSSASSFNAQGIRLGIGVVPVIGESSLTAISNVVVLQPVQIYGDSAFSLFGRRIAISGSTMPSVSMMSCNAVLKWAQNGQTPEDWTTVPGSSDIWTPVDDTAEVWSSA